LRLLLGKLPDCARLAMVLGSLGLSMFMLCFASAAPTSVPEMFGWICGLTIDSLAWFLMISIRMLARVRSSGNIA
jgi:hypothetical protein